MNLTTGLVVLGGVLIFGVVAYLIVSKVESQNQFGDLLGGVESLL